MPKGIYAAASAMYVDGRAMDAMASNLANVTTTGYRRAEPLRRSFAELMAAEQGRLGGPDADGGMGVLKDGHWRSFGQGESRDTADPLSVALQGEGFLVVEDPRRGQLLTRAGGFVLDEGGQLRTPEGFLVQGQGGPITIPPQAAGIDIDAGGRIYARINTQDGVNSTFVEQLRIVTVEEPNRMRADNGVHFQPGQQQLRDATAVKVQQGREEIANLDAVQEMVRMIELQRRYDAAQRALKTHERAGEGLSEVLRG